MRRSFRTVAILSLLTFAAVMYHPAEVNSAPPFGGPEDVNDSEQLWQALIDARLVGSQAITAMPYDGSVHKTILVTLDSTLSVGDHTSGETFNFKAGDRWYTVPGHEVTLSNRGTVDHEHLFYTMIAAK